MICHVFYVQNISARSTEGALKESEPGFLPMVRPFSETVHMMQDICISWRAPILSELRFSERGAPGRQETKKIFGTVRLIK
jgi:hypothetical protein